MKKVTFGIDIGGINTAIGIVSEEGEIFVEDGFKTAEYPLKEDYPRYVAKLAQTMKSMMESLSFDYELVGVGIGAPNACYLNGCIEQPANLWKSDSCDPKDKIFPLVADLQPHFPEASIAITNDANAATIGEMLFGNAKGMRDFIMITLGTGLGSGFVSNGQMIYGHDGFAGELGHVIVEREGRSCGCGRKGCLETYVSATGIKRTAFDLIASSTTPSSLREVSFDALDSFMIYKAACANDPLALEAFRYTGEMLGRALADVCTVTSPEAIIIFGGLAKAGELIFEPTKRYMEENIFAPLKGKVKLLPSGIEDRNTAVIGASALIWQQCNNC